jgi:anaerobic selenocysteine-containing dehydrogenase
MVANVAAEDEPVPDAGTAELELFRTARRHLKPEVFEEPRWKKTVAEKLWPKVVYLLNRGGRFEDYRADKLFKDGRHSNAYKKLLSLYCEKVAGFKNAFTGRNYAGYPCYIPVADALGRPFAKAFGKTQEEMETEYPFTLLTHRVIAMTKSRTISNYWLLALAPDNAVLLNPGDARKQGIKDGARVRVVSVTNPEGVWELGPEWTKPMEGRVKLTEMIMPGCVSFSLGHGHWAIGSSDQTIDGETIRADPRRAQGVHANAAMWVDPHLKNTCMLDPIGGSVSFYDTRVRLERV